MLHNKIKIAVPPVIIARDRLPRRQRITEKKLRSTSKVHRAVIVMRIQRRPALEINPYKPTHGNREQCLWNLPPIYGPLVLRHRLRLKRKQFEKPCNRRSHRGDRKQQIRVSPPVSHPNVEMDQRERQARGCHHGPDGSNPAQWNTCGGHRRIAKAGFPPPAVHSAAPGSGLRQVDRSGTI